MPYTTTPAGTRLHYDEIGDSSAPVMLLIQGLGAQLLGWHPDLCRQLADTGYRVIRFDNRDVGLSQRFPEVSYTVADMAIDAVGLLDALHIDAAHIVGQSMGGMISQHLAAEHRDRVSSLALLYTAPNLSHVIGMDIISARTAAPNPRNREEAVAQYLDGESVCASTAYPQDLDWLRELGGQMWDRGHDPTGVLRQAEAVLASADRAPILPYVTAPTTILHGTVDRLLSPDGAQEIHALIPGSTLVVHDGMGHELPRPLWPAIVNQVVMNARRADDECAHPVVAGRM